LSKNSGASTFRKPKGLSRPVAGKLYLYLYPEDENSVSLQNVVSYNMTQAYSNVLIRPYYATTILISKGLPVSAYIMIIITSYLSKRR
jgi:hypothetical protein